jgi:hypothetical protein
LLLRLPLATSAAAAVELGPDVHSMLSLWQTAVKPAALDTLQANKNRPQMEELLF